LNPGAAARRVSSMSRAVYKIFRPEEWRSFAANGSFAGSPDDQRDGFIHLSYAEQVSGTLDKHYANEREVVLAAFDASALRTLRDEVSRNGAVFPHLYGTLPRQALFEFETLARTPAGFALPDWCRQ
jgi:uncharacterized protein (DUF952 family)